MFEEDFGHCPIFYIKGVQQHSVAACLMQIGFSAALGYAVEAFAQGCRRGACASIAIVLPGRGHTATTRVPLHPACGPTPKGMDVHCPASWAANCWRQRFYHEGHDARSAGLETVGEKLYLTCGAEDAGV